MSTFHELITNARFLDPTASYVQLCEEDLKSSEIECAHFETYVLRCGRIEVTIRAAELKGQLFVKWMRARVPAASGNFAGLKEKEYERARKS